MHRARRTTRRGRLKIPNESPTYIYGLYAEEEGIIRYVGKTVFPGERLNGHASASTNRQMRDWVKQVRAAGCEVRMAYLAICFDPIEANFAEKFWIDHYRSRWGVALLNGLGPRLESAVHFSKDGPSQALRHQQAAGKLGLTLYDYYRESADILANLTLGKADGETAWKPSPKVSVSRTDPNAFGSVVSMVGM